MYNLLLRNTQSIFSWPRTGSEQQRSIQLNGYTKQTHPHRTTKDQQKPHPSMCTLSAVWTHTQILQQTICMCQTWRPTQKQGLHKNQRHSSKMCPLWWKSSIKLQRMWVLSQYHQRRKSPQKLPGNRNHPLHKNSPTQPPYSKPHTPPPPKHPRTYAEVVNTKPQIDRGPKFHTHHLPWRIQKPLPTTHTAKQHDPKHALNANKQTSLHTTE